MMDRTLLVADNDALMVESLAFTLGQQGYDVEIATTSHEVLERSRKRPADLVVLGPSLRDMHGTEVYRQLRSFWSGPVIMIPERETTEPRNGVAAAAGRSLLTRDLAQQIRVRLGRPLRAPAFA